MMEKVWKFLSAALLIFVGILTFRNWRLKRTQNKVEGELALAVYKKAEEDVEREREEIQEEIIEEIVGNNDSGVDRLMQRDRIRAEVSAPDSPGDPNEPPTVSKR